MNYPPLSTIVPSAGCQAGSSLARTAVIPGGEQAPHGRGKAKGSGKNTEKNGKPLGGGDSVYICVYAVCLGMLYIYILYIYMCVCVNLKLWKVKYISEYLYEYVFDMCSIVYMILIKCLYTYNVCIYVYLYVIQV